MKPTQYYIFGLDSRNQRLYNASVLIYGSVIFESNNHKGALDRYLETWNSKNSRDIGHFIVYEKSTGSSKCYEMEVCVRYDTQEIDMGGLEYTSNLVNIAMAVFNKEVE